MGLLNENALVLFPTPPVASREIWKFFFSISLPARFAFVSTVLNPYQRICPFLHLPHYNSFPRLLSTLVTIPSPLLLQVLHSLPSSVLSVLAFPGQYSNQ